MNILNTIRNWHRCMMDTTVECQWFFYHGDLVMIRQYSCKKCGKKEPKEYLGIATKENIQEARDRETIELADTTCPVCAELKAKLNAAHKDVRALAALMRDIGIWVRGKEHDKEYEIITEMLARPSVREIVEGV